MSSTPFAPRENSEASDETPEREAGSQPMWLNVTLKHHRRLRERFRLSRVEKFINGGGCLIIKTTTPRIPCSWPVCLNDQIHNQSVIFPLRSWFWSCFRAWQKSIFQPEARWQKTPVTTEVLLFNNEHKDCVFSVCVCVCVCSRVQGPPSQPISSLVSNAGPKAEGFFLSHRATSRHWLNAQKCTKNIQEQKRKNLFWQFSIWRRWFLMRSVTSHQWGKKTHWVLI